MEIKVEVADPLKIQFQLDSSVHSFFLLKRITAWWRLSPWYEWLPHPQRPPSMYSFRLLLSQCHLASFSSVIFETVQRTFNNFASFWQEQEPQNRKRHVVCLNTEPEYIATGSVFLGEVEQAEPLGDVVAVEVVAKVGKSDRILKTFWFSYQSVMSLTTR